MTFKAFSFVASSTTGGAQPATYASFHLRAHKHHLSPGTKPGKLYNGFGDDRSFPLDLVKSRNSWVITAATR